MSKKYKCKICKDIGFISLGNNIRGIKICSCKQPIKCKSMELTMMCYDDKYHDYKENGGTLLFGEWLLEKHNIIEVK